MILLLNLSLVGCSNLINNIEQNNFNLSESTKYNNSIFYYDDQVNRNLIKKAIEAVKLADIENNKYLSQTKTKLYIYLLDEERFNLEFGDYGIARGLYNANNLSVFIKIVEDEDSLFYFDTIDAAIQNTIAHEYTHFRFSEEIKEFGLDDDIVPIWFNEGYSEFIANKISEKASPMYTEFSEEIYKPYNKLVSNEEWQKNSGDYIQVLITMNEIIESGSNETIKTVMNGLIQGNELDSILSNSFNIDVNSDDFGLLIKKKMKEFYVDGVSFYN